MRDLEDFTTAELKGIQEALEFLCLVGLSFHVERFGWMKHRVDSVISLRALNGQ